MLKVDDGVSPRELKIELLREALHAVRKNYVKCLEKTKPEICHAVAVNDLLDIFGSLLPNVIYDAEFRYFLIKGVENLFLYDAETDTIKITTIGNLVNNCLHKKS